jgi:hypothetical protein
MDAMLGEVEALVAEHGEWSAAARAREEDAEASLLARARELS